jgi:4-aminobutyrate aminotransferase-like enzyme
VLPEGYLNAVYEHVRKADALCVADEVQVGFGRAGEAFWGFELQGVVPDIVVLGKPMGNGHPMGAVVTTDEVAQSFENGMEFFSSFGGNPVSCEIGKAVLEVIEAENLQHHARQVGMYLLSAFSQLKPAYPFIGDVRGKGLFLGIELIRNPNTLEPAAELASEIVAQMKTQGILLSTDGPHHNVIKFKPPLCFSMDNAKRLVEVFSTIVAAIDFP